jgi:hypothetical protein
LYVSLYLHLKLTPHTQFVHLIIQGAGVTAWLGGTIAIFVAAYAFALGVWGLFGSWTRRQSILMAIFAVLLIAFIIVNIILAATNNGTNSF